MMKLPLRYLTPLVLLSIYTIPSDLPYQTQELLKLHEVLSEFILRGQTVVELIPPLSYVIAWYTKSWASYVDVISQLIWAAPLMGHIFYACAGRFRRDMVSATLFIGWLAVHSHFKPGLGLPFSTANNIAECLLGLSFAYPFYICYVPAEVRLMESFFGVMEVLPIVSISLGCNTVDAGFCYSYVFLHRISSIFVEIADQTQSMTKILIWALFTMARSCFMPVLVLTVIHGTIFPASETAAGGNYNLHFLPAHFRRDWVPEHRLLNSTFFESLVPPFSLRPLTPMSIYLPQAGFLWTDELVWNEEAGTFDTSSDYAKKIKKVPHHLSNTKTRSDSLEIPPHRSFFLDKFNRRHPWSLIPVGPEDTASAHRHPAIMGGFLRNRELVFIRSDIDHRYLGVEPGAQSLIDEEFERGFDRTKDEFVRLRVGTFSEGKESCIWVLEYDPFSDRGFRLYNAANKCHLASSFRTFPNYDGDGYDQDIIMAQLGLELEVVCTSEANDAASRMYILEGMTSFQQKRYPTDSIVDSFRSYTISIGRFCYHGFSMLWATYSLARFRALYAGIQDTPAFLLELTRPTTARGDTSAEYFSALFAFAYLVHRMYRHRHPKDISHQNGSPDSIWSVCFVVVRLGWTRLLAKNMAYAPRLLVLVSALSLMRLLEEVDY